MAARWKEDHGSITDLIALTTSDPRALPAIVVSLTGGGATLDDLHWLNANRVLEHVTQHDVSRLEQQLANHPSVPDRRLLLVLVLRSHYALNAARTILAAVNNAPWTDTATRLILDHTDPAIAINIARADHDLEQRIIRTDTTRRTDTRRTTTPERTLASERSTP